MLACFILTNLRRILVSESVNFRKLRTLRLIKGRSDTHSVRVTEYYYKIIVPDESDALDIMLVAPVAKLPLRAATRNETLNLEGVVSIPFRYPILTSGLAAERQHGQPIYV